MEESTVNWLHISDLHFGNNNPKMERMRESLKDYLSEYRKNKNIDYLFITGDLVFGPACENKNRYTDIQNEVINYINLIIEILKINNDNVFIIPGNHDIMGFKNKNKEVLIEKIRENYSLDRSIGESELSELNEFLYGYRNICQELKVNYCQCAHKFYETIKINVLLLNTALTTIDSKSDKASLNLGLNLFDEEFKKVNQKKPLFIIGHHSIDWFCERDSKQLYHDFKSFRSNHNQEVFYLCGHEHEVSVENKENINVILCGTTQVIDRWSDGVTFFDMKILFGAYNLEDEEVRIECHKCRYASEKNKWQPDRDISDNEPFYIQKLSVKHSERKNVIKATSELEARRKFEQYILDFIETPSITPTTDK